MGIARNHESDRVLMLRMLCLYAIARGVVEALSLPRPLVWNPSDPQEFVDPAASGLVPLKEGWASCWDYVGDYYRGHEGGY